MYTTCNYFEERHATILTARSVALFILQLFLNLDIFILFFQHTGFDLNILFTKYIQIVIYLLMIVYLTVLYVE